METEMLLRIWPSNLTQQLRAVLELEHVII